MTGLISAALSFPVYVLPRSGEERGLLSRTAAGNRAYTFMREFGTKEGTLSDVADFSLTVFS